MKKKQYYVTFAKEDSFESKISSKILNHIRNPGCMIELLKLDIFVNIWIQKEKKIPSNNTNT